jgi:DNA polymerase IV
MFQQHFLLKEPNLEAGGLQKGVDFSRLYIDFDSFFASAEQHFNPELRGRPVGVVPLISNHTVLIAASREAKQFGLKTGTPVIDARRLCPGVVLVPARHDAYVRLHHQIVGIVDSIVPVHRTRSIDEVYCQLLRNEQERAVEIAREIKAALVRDIGPVLTCSIGLAPNELLAKIAAEMQKPNGLVALSQADLPGPLLELKLTDIPGIAKGNVARLAAVGVTTIAELWALPRPHMRAIWGGVGGERFWAFLHGFEIEREATQRSMFGHSRVLGWDWRSPERTEACARLLLVKATRRMRREGFSARVLSLALRAEGKNGERGPGWYSEIRMPAFRDDHTALSALAGLFAQAREQQALQRTKKVHVTLTGLVKSDSIQLDFLELQANTHNRARWERLSDLTDALYVRYKKFILTLGPQFDSPGSYAGAKIAFGRIPDLADFDV